MTFLASNQNGTQTATVSAVAVTAASNASPISITATAHGRSTGDIVYLSGVGGNLAANGVWTITKVDNNTFTLDGSTGSAAWTAGGTVAVVHALGTAITAAGDFMLSVDAGLLVNGETLTLRHKTKTLTGGTLRYGSLGIWKNALADPLIFTAEIPSLYSIQFFLQQDGGTGRAFDWNIVQTDSSVSQTGDSYPEVTNGSYGLAKLVRSTTPANTFDVSATGEGGVDWANVGSKTTSNALTGTTISTSQVAASVTGAVGSVTAGVSLGVDAVNSSAVAATGSAELADALLARNAKGGSDGPAASSVAAAIAGGFMRIDITAGVLTVLYPDGTTAFTRTLTRQALNAIVNAVP